MIEKMLFWIIRSINTQNSFGRLMEINRRYHFSFIAIMEPFQAPDKVEDYGRRLGFDHATISTSSKIWIF